MRYRGALVVALTGAVACAIVSMPAAQGDAPTICVAAPYPDGSSASLAAPLRDAIVQGLLALNAHAIALDAGYDGALAESASKNCSQIVLTKVQSATGGGRFGMVNRLMRGKGDQSWTTTPPDGASPATSLAAAEQQTIRRGQTLTLEYRLTPGRSLTPIKSDKLEGKANADGEDVLGPLVSQVASAVLAGAGSTRTGTTAESTTTDTKTKDGRSNASTSKAAAPQNQNIDCDQVAKASRGTFTVEACKQMQASQQAMTAAANAPAASRPGDDTLTCDQIAAEIKEQRMPTVDQAKVAEAQAATTDFQKKAAEEQKEREALAAKESAETSIVSKVVPVNAVGAANQKKIDAEQKAANEKAEKELAPKAERAMSANAAMISDLTSQMAANPRLARLFQLASDRKCKLQ